VQAEGAPNAAGAPAGAQHSTEAEQINAMVEKLAARLKEQPKDVEGWSMLARSYSAIGKNNEAVAAFEKAIALKKDDANLLADYGDALAVKNNRTIAGEPLKWIEKALKIDPKNLKALALLGSHSFEKKDYAGAVKTWEKLVAIGPADNVFVKQSASAIDEARTLGGLPGAKPLDALISGAGPLDAAPKADAPAAAAGAGVVAGVVTLSDTIKAQASPDDTVFIFARPAEGSRMPLAILRKQVKDLPIAFSLDDSMAMSPASKLSGVAKVIVGARISKSGNAIPQVGDLSGQTAPIAVGAKDLKISISEVVKK
jgi:cytochrome c-type biogenesis protein CcmH